MLFYVVLFQVKVVDEKAFKQVVEEEIRKLDRQENESMPQVTLSTNFVSAHTLSLFCSLIVSYILCNISYY